MNFLKKVLDNSLERVYNIRTGLKDAKDMFKVDEDYIAATSIDLALSVEILTNICRIEIGLLELQKKYNLPPFHIAGGCVRDAILGFWPKDIDVFIQMEDYSNEDDLDLYGSNLSNIRPAEFNENYDKATFEKNEEKFPVFYGVTPDDQFLINLIGRKDLAENPLDLVNTFDYNLVKGWFKDGQFVITPEMKECLDTKTVVLENDSSFERFYKWERRNMIGNWKIVVEVEKITPTKFYANTVKPMKWLHDGVRLGENQFINNVGEVFIRHEENRVERIDGFEVANF